MLAALAGCTSILGGGPSETELTQNATYEWDTNATASYNVSRSEFTGVVTVENSTFVDLYRRGELGNDEPLDVAALQYRYPNGTVVTANDSALSAETRNSRLNVSLPQAGGQVAFTADRPTGKQFTTPVFVEGVSHEVTLPPRARVGVPLLSRVSPSSDSTRVVDNRMTIRWEELSRSSLIVRYYLARDLPLFGGLGGVLVLVGIGGSVYYLRQIRVLKRRREEIAPDVETEDDDFGDDGPPPGMR